MMRERGISLAHTTILRWVQRGCGSQAYWRVAEPSNRADEQVPEQHCRTGPPASEATASSDAGTQELPNGGESHQWNRVGGEDQEEPVQNRKARRAQRDDAGDLASRFGRVVGSKSI